MPDYSYSEVRNYDAATLKDLFHGARKPEPLDNGWQLWLEEIAIGIAKSDPKGVDFLLACLAWRRRSAVAGRFARPGSSPSSCRCANTPGFASWPSRFSTMGGAGRRGSRQIPCVGMSVGGRVAPLLQHASPYVVGSACASSPGTILRKLCLCWKARWKPTTQSCVRTPSMNWMT